MPANHSLYLGSRNVGNIASQSGLVRRTGVKHQPSTSQQRSYTPSSTHYTTAIHTPTHGRRPLTEHTAAYCSARLVSLDCRSLHAPFAMSRLLLPLVVVAALAPYAHAAVKFTSPTAGAVLTAGQSIDVKWEDDGESPKLTDLLTFELFLCAGGNTDGSNVSANLFCCSMAVNPRERTPFGRRCADPDPASPASHHNTGLVRGRQLCFGNGRRYSG